MMAIRFPEQFLAVVGAAACLLISARIGQAVGAMQAIWPLPGLYLVEMNIVSVLGLFGVLGNSSGRSSLRIGLTYAAVGILLAFVLLGAWSIGPFFLPVVLIFAVAAILSSRKQGQNIFLHMGIGFLAAVAQVALMLAAIQVLYPSTIF